MKVKVSAPIHENRHVRELLTVMKANNMDAGELTAILSHVGAMERQLDKAVTELNTMRGELDGMREARDHPAALPLRNAVREMEKNVGAARWPGWSGRLRGRPSSKPSGKANRGRRRRRLPPWINPGSRSLLCDRRR